MLWFHWDSKSCSQSDQQATKPWLRPIFGASLVLGSAVWLLLCPITELVVTDCCVKSAFRHNVHLIKKSLLIVAYSKRRQCYKMTIFKFWLLAWGTHLSSFFTFPVCFKCSMTVEWTMLSSLTTSHIVVRGSSSKTLSIGSCQLLMAYYCYPTGLSSHL